MRQARHLSRLYAFGAVWMGVIVMPIYVPFLTSRGLTVGDVLSLQAIYGAAVTLLEIPTGYICDLVGRQRTILVGTMLNLLGLALFALARGFTTYAAIELLLAAGWSLVSGADIALIYEILDLADAGRDARRQALGNYVLAQVMGEAVAALVGGALAGWSLAAVGWATAAEAILPLLIALGLPRYDRRTNQGMVGSDLLLAIKDLCRERSRWLLFANIVIWGLSTFIAVWLLQPYWRQQSVSLRWFGVLWAGTLVTVGVVGRAAPALTRTIGLRRVVMVLTIAPILAYGSMAWLGGPAGIACGFLFYISRGLNSVSLREAFNDKISSRLRATFNSMVSGASRLIFALCGPLIGVMLDRAGMTLVLAVLAVSFAAAFVLVTVPLLRQPGI
jgi:predicted MFS family arabinose efflux permease